MMDNNDNPERSKSSLRVDQANVFYNYTIGFEAPYIDLVGTAKNLVKNGITRTVFFSDFKFLYTDTNEKLQLDWIQPKGRQWDSEWHVQFSPKVPEAAITDLSLAMEVSFHEERIEGPDVRQSAPYLRASLPPIVLESDDFTLPLFVSVKIFADGIAILSFQLDTTWDGIDENDFISNIVNLFQFYFKRIWTDSRIQRRDAEELIPNAFQDEMSIAGVDFRSRKTNRLVKKMRKESQETLNKALNEQGKLFDICNEEWILHEIVGSKNQNSWESTFELCRSQYTNAMLGLIVHTQDKRKLREGLSLIWQGRPSISLMRFSDQPTTKSELLSRFTPSLSKILMRSAEIENPTELPPDLRPFEDQCFHGNRALLLWTWLRPDDEPDNVWDDPNIRAKIMQNQARTEHIEYHNMCTVRACAWAKSPPSGDHLKEAYKTLAFTEDLIHHSSQAGEISDALAYLMEAFGTLKLVPSGKETARWYLDELRYRSDRSRNRMDRLITFVFGVVGASGLADFVIRPFLIAAWPGLSNISVPIIAFGIASLIVFFVGIIIWLFTKTGYEN
ncbi:MAG: hypothetical protein HF978_18670 [Desulfobacteraceae bacterium]|nr:hypothetical protein [Desulfobacteraceae bacterium]MBC2757572.1 hypothetical protein [Desulfobacteraceae bacterium]